MVKNLIICENLKYPPDEGASNLAVEFIKSLGEEVSIINFGQTISVGNIESVGISHKRIPIVGFIFSRLISFLYIIKKKPKNVYYFPLCAPKLINQLYAFMVSILVDNFKEILFQIGDFGILTKLFSRFKIAAYSRDSAETLLKSGLSAEYLFIPHIVPNRGYNKEKIREKYSIGKDDFVALHVGHAEDGRGLGVLSKLQDNMPEIRIVLVLSSRKKIKENLLNPKIKVINQYLKDIYEMYAIADVYLFPIKSRKSAIDVPLSIIEAKEMALPIVASDVGSVKEVLKKYSRGFLIKVKDEKQMAKDIQYILEQKIIKKL